VTTEGHGASIGEEEQQEQQSKTALYVRTNAGKNMIRFLKSLILLLLTTDITVFTVVLNVAGEKKVYQSVLFK
jgi:hypothetical protein